MNTGNVSISGPSTVTPPPPAKQSGTKIVLQRIGIPAWLLKRPKLPSRNWLIFLSITSSVAGCYIYDRRQCKQIRKEYADKVRHFAEEPLGSLEMPRKVVVYGAKWPGDDDWDRSMKYFRKYVKPILVAAAVDYDMIKGKRQGDIADRIAEEVKSHRRALLGLDPPKKKIMPLPTDQTPEAVRRRELDGGIVIIGRPTFKEFMEGLKRGWTESARKVDREEDLARALENDGHFDFDAPEPEGLLHDPDSEPLPTPSKLPSSIYSSIQISKAVSKKDASMTETLDTPPSSITPLPPLLLVPFTNYLGFKQMPLMLWDIFNERHKVRAGAEAAYKLIIRHTRPFIGPPSSPSPHWEAQGSEASTNPSTTTQTDLNFDRLGESYYKSSTSSIPADMEKARQEYYKTLRDKLKTARDLAEGLREPTKDEKNYPPPTEVELRAERMKNELRWRDNEKGWEIVRPDKEVAWDERFAGVLRVFDDPPTPEKDEQYGESKSL